MTMTITKTTDDITPNTKQFSIYFHRIDRHGDRVLVGKMTRLSGERQWAMSYHGEDMGNYSRSDAYEWLEMKAEREARWG